MAIQCPKCRRGYDITLFQFGRTVKCECGQVVDAREPQRRFLETAPPDRGQPRRTSPRKDRVTRRQFGRESARALLGAGAAAFLVRPTQGQSPSVPPRQAPRRPKMKLVITVESIKGRCPAYKVGDKIVLDKGYKFNLQETTNACMHSLASVMPYHVAIAKGVEPRQMGLARKDKDDGKAYVHCLDPCDVTGGGTVTFSIERVAGT